MCNNCGCLSDIQIGDEVLVLLGKRKGQVVDIDVWHAYTSYYVATEDKRPDQAPYELYAHEIKRL